MFPSSAAYVGQTISTIQQQGRQHAAGTAFYSFQSIHHTIDILSRAIPQAHRHQVLQNTLRCLSHEDVMLHNYEMDLGADRALCLQLGYLDMIMTATTQNVPSYVHRDLNAQEEVNGFSQFQTDLSLLYSCLLQLYQCSRERRLRSFHQVGQLELIPVTISILRKCMQQFHKTGELHCSMHLVESMLKLIRVFAKLESHVKSFLIQWQDGSLITLLLGLLTENNDKIEVVKQECLALIKNLTFRLENDDKVYLYRRTKDMLVQIASSVRDDGCNGRPLASISATFWNFTVSNSINVDMAQQQDVLQSLYRMILHQNPEDVEMQLITKRNAMSALGNIAAGISETASPVPSGDHTINSPKDQSDVFHSQEWFLPAVMKLLQDEKDTDIQRRAMRTLRCIAACHRGRQRIWKLHDLIKFVTSYLGKHDLVDTDTRIQACETMGHLAEEPEKLRGIELQLEAKLIQIIESSAKDPRRQPKEVKLVAAAVRVLSVCIERVFHKREGFSSMFFEKLLACSKVEQELTHPPIARLLLQLAVDQQIPPTDENKDNGNQEPQCPQRKGQNKLLCSPMLYTLSELLMTVGLEFEQSHDDTLRTIQMLVEGNNKGVLAENEGLLTALVSFALATGQSEKKRVSKQLILELVPEL